MPLFVLLTSFTANCTHLLTSSPQWAANPLWQPQCHQRPQQTAVLPLATPTPCSSSPGPWLTQSQRTCAGLNHVNPHCINTKHGCSTATATHPCCFRAVQQPWGQRQLPTRAGMMSHTEQMQADLYGNRHSSCANHTEFKQGQQHTLSGTTHRLLKQSKPLDYILYILLEIK